MARNPKVELRGHEGQVVHPITDGDCVIFPNGETLSHKLSEQEEVMYAPEVTNSSPMFKVGEGDSSDYSANVLDGAYQEAVLKGQTYVNTIQERSADVITLPTPFTEYERTQSKTFTEMQDGTFGLNLVGQSYVNCIQEPSEPSYVALGESLEFQNKKVEYTNDGQIKSAMLNGQTLVNLCSLGNVRPNDNVNISTTINDVMTLKSNTKYIIKADIVDVIEGSTTSGININILMTNTYNNGSLEKSEPIMNDLSTTKINKIFTTTSNTTHFKLNRSYGNATFNNLMLIEYQEGMENWDIPYFQGMQSVTMATELENVCGRYNSSGAKNGKTFTVGTNNERILQLANIDNISNYNFKQNTKYLIQFKITNLNLDGEEYIKLIFSNSTVASGNALFGDYSSTIVKITKNGIYRTVLTTSTVIDTSGFIIKGLAEQWEESTSTTRTLTISQIMCIEYQNGMENWDLPYFEDYQVMKPVQVESISKNIFTTQDVLGANVTTYTINNANSVTITGTNNTRTYKNTQFLINVKPNTDYKISFKHEKVSGETTAHCDVYSIPENGEAKKYLGGTVINSGEYTQLEVRFYVNTTEASQNGTIRYYDIQMEEGSTATDYVPHQSKTTSALEPITLRAIGNVKDTLDLSTGEYVQRIGEKTFTSDNENYQVSIDEATPNITHIRLDADANKYAPNQRNGRNPLTNIIPNNPIYRYSDNTEGIYVDASGILVLCLSREKATTVDEFKTWLVSNPITVQYVLTTPIIHKVNLSRPNLQTYQDITHVQSIAMDGTLIPNIYLPSDISYKAMLKPNTSYNVIVDREVIDSTNQLTVNLGGTTANITANRTVVTTPSTLSNETLTFSGKDNRVAKAMLIEGSTLINGDLPHFNGIGSVQLGKTIENLCGSSEYGAGTAQTSYTLTNNSITVNVRVAGTRLFGFDLLKPLENNKKYFIYAPQTYDNTLYKVSFKSSYNGSSTYSKQLQTLSKIGKAIIEIDQTDVPYSQIVVGIHTNISVDTIYTIRRPILCEYIDGMENWDWESIGYFTGTRNIGNEFMRIGNKNLFDWNSFKEKIKNESCFTILDNGFKADSSKGGSVGNFLRDKYKFAEGIFKENTQYTISWDATHEGDLYLSPFVAYTDGTHEGISIGGNGKRILTTAANKTVRLFSVTWLTQTGNGKSTLTNIQIEEASSATSYVAHKHNSLHILPDKQIPLTFEQGAINYAEGDTWANAINNTYNIRIRTQLLNLEPNETYRISCGNNGYNFAVYSYDNSSLGTSGTGWLGGEYYISTTKDINKIAITIRKPDDSNITPSVLHQVRLEKVTNVTLRGFGGVCDELDVARGVYIQRIGEVVLDGSEKWRYIDSAVIKYFYISKVDLAIPYQNQTYTPLCDKLQGVDNINNIDKSIKCGNNHAFQIRYDEFTSLDDLKTWLQQNPITVQYALETPIEHKINIPMKNELNQTIAKPNGIFTLPLMHSETNHIDINSQIYPKVQSRDYISYPVIANNSQLHTVFHNKVGTGNLTVNLCGTSVTSVDGTSKCTITTPSSISQYELRLSGARNKVSNVCVFSGDYMNVDVPYVQGMMNAVNPIVKNVGKNLFDLSYIGNYKNWINNSVGISFNDYPYIRIQLKPKTNYVFTRNSADNPSGTGAMSHIVVHTLENKQGVNWLYHHEYPSLNNKTVYIRTSNSGVLILAISTCTNQNILTNIMQGFSEAIIEESSTPSQYEPYKENNCVPHSDETITLRSLPNGVRDELNLQTGEYIQRVGEYTLNGDEDWRANTDLNTDRTSFFYLINGKKPADMLGMSAEETSYASAYGFVSGSRVIRNQLLDKKVEAVMCGDGSYGMIQVMVAKDKLYSDNLNGFKEYLSKQPITVQYQLDTPIVKQIDIHNYPHSYKDGHIIIESNDPSTNVTAQMTYQCVANRTGQIQEHTEQIEKQEYEINELEMLILENIRQQQNR